MKSILLEIVFMLAQGFLFWLTTFAIEKSWFTALKGSLSSSKSHSSKVSPSFQMNGSSKTARGLNAEDSDVLEEEELLRKMPADTHPLMVRKLEKW